MILPTIRQIQIIAELLTDAAIPARVCPDQFTPPWREYYRWCLEWIQEEPESAHPQELEHDFVQQFAAASTDHLNNYQLIREAGNAPISYPPAHQSLAQIGELQWLWSGWLLRGLPSLLAGVPGSGKSYLAFDIAHRVIAGTCYPDGQPVETPGPVLYVDAENTPVIHKARISVWPRAALQGLYIMLPEPDQLVINLDDFRDRDRLRDMAWVIGPILIIIDSYGSCTLRGENNKEDVQVLLAFFTQLARDFDCGVLVIHHLRKTASANPQAFTPISVDSIRGSSHIAAMARHIWGLQFVPTSREPDDNGPRRLWVMKTNVGPPPKPLGVAFGPHADAPQIAQLTYGDAPQPYREPTRVDACGDWILSELTAAGEPIKPAALVARGEDQGYYKMLIYRARKRLGARIVDSDGRGHPRNAWGLREWDDDSARSNGRSQDAPTQTEGNGRAAADEEQG